jgi:phosphatidate cytidylyltransferase
VPVRKRLTFGPILIALVVLICWFDQRIQGAALPETLRPLFLGRDTVPPGVALFCIVILLSVLASRELVRIMRDNGIKSTKRITTAAAIIGLLTSAVIPGCSLQTPHAVALACSAAVAVLVVSLVFYSRNKTFEGIVGAAGGTMLAFVYLGLMFGFILAIRREHSVWIVLWVILTTKNCDTGAYFTGKSIGRHKLIFWLSPGKTWEGLAGGVAFAALSGVLGLWLISACNGAPGEHLPPLWTGAVAGALFGLFGQAGDLIASLFKRDAGLKDSSHILPGFGGVLDIIDSPLLVAPVAYWWLLAVHRLPIA